MTSVGSSAACANLGQVGARGELLRHLAAHQHAVGEAGQPPQDADLVVDLGPADDRHERAIRIVDEPSELPELPLEQEPRIGREEMCHTLGRGVRAMGRAEGVVHEQVSSVGELPGERRVVRRLAGMEAGVLEHGEAFVRKQLAQPRLDGSHPIGIVVALRPAEMRADDDVHGAPFEQQPQRRQRRPDPCVVRDATVLERHVQVDADEDALSGDVGVADRPRPPHLKGAFAPDRRDGTSSPNRSTWGNPWFPHEPPPSTIKGASAPDRRDGTSSPIRCRTTRTPSPRSRAPWSAASRRSTSTSSR